MDDTERSVLDGRLTRWSFPSHDVHRLSYRRVTYFPYGPARLRPGGAPCREPPRRPIAEDRSLRNSTSFLCRTPSASRRQRRSPYPREREAGRCRNVKTVLVVMSPYAPTARRPLLAASRARISTGRDALRRLPPSIDASAGHRPTDMTSPVLTKAESTSRRGTDIPDREERLLLEDGHEIERWRGRCRLLRAPFDPRRSSRPCGGAWRLRVSGSRLKVTAAPSCDSGASALACRCRPGAAGRNGILIGFLVQPRVQLYIQSRRPRRASRPRLCRGQDIVIDFRGRGDTQLRVGLRFGRSIKLW